PVTESKGSVRLMVNKKRKSFKVADLILSNVNVTETKGKGWTRKPSEPVVSNTEKVQTIKKATAKAETKASKAKDNTVAKDKEKFSPAELIKMGIYPYKIKGIDEIK